jgi:hypothetical protein
MTLAEIITDLQQIQNKKKLDDDTDVFIRLRIGEQIENYLDVTEVVVDRIDDEADDESDVVILEI